MPSTSAGVATRSSANRIASPRSQSARVSTRRSAPRRNSPRRSTPERSLPRWEAEDGVLDLQQARVERDEQRSSARRDAAGAERAQSTPDAARCPSCPPCHWGLILVTLLLSLASIPMIYSASQSIALDNHGSTDYFLIRQIAFVAIGFCVMIGASRLPVKALRGMAWVLYLVALAGLLATKFSPLGVSMGGVERWLRVGPIPLQVSEIAKFALIGVLADFWSRAAKSSQKSGWPWIVAFAIAAIPIGLVFLQPHLSATLVLFVIPIVLGFYAGVPAKQIGVLCGTLAVAAAVIIGLCSVGQMPGVKPYQQERIAHFLATENDEKGAHYQTEQGLRAIERGGLTGAGPGGSLFKQGHLPAPHTDFILAVIGEEAGLAGMLVLLALYGAMIFFCFQIGYNAREPFEMLLCAGVGSLLALQVICNLGVVLDVMPVTGMPLPMMSYGGSGLLCTLLGVGWVLGVSRNGARDEKPGVKATG